MTENIPDVRITVLTFAFLSLRNFNAAKTSSRVGGNLAGVGTVTLGCGIL